MEEVKGYPPIEPYMTGTLQVDDIHTLYFEESGNPNGNPVVFLHGGPGAGTTAADRTFFDPNIYRIVIFHQRGAGKSTPYAELKNNTSSHVVEDIEKLRKHLAIDRWVVFGGSWGSTLALLYAEKHSQRVKALIIRGIFTFRREEVQWFFQSGAHQFFPEAYEKFISVIPEEERNNLIAAYYKRLTGDEDNEAKLKYARAWSMWECLSSKLVPDDEATILKVISDEWVLQFARIECHYMFNYGFLESDDYIMDNVDKLKDIPVTIVQGRYDVVCLPVIAYKLHKKLPKSELHLMTAGHFSREPEICTQLILATDKYKTL